MVPYTPNLLTHLKPKLQYTVPCYSQHESYFHVQMLPNKPTVQGVFEIKSDWFYIGYMGCIGDKTVLFFATDSGNKGLYCIKITTISVQYYFYTYWYRRTSWAPAFLSGHDVTCMSDCSPPSPDKYINTWTKAERKEREKEGSPTTVQGYLLKTLFLHSGQNTKCSDKPAIL